MYDTQAAVQNTQYANTAVQGTIGGSQLQKPLIADAMLRELSTLVEKASSIQNRQQNLKDRIFGSAPECPSAEGKNAPTPQGFLHEANYKLQLLNSIMDRITQNCVEMERLA